MVIHKELTIGELSSYLMYTIMLALTIAFLSSAIGDISNSMAACERVFEIIDYNQKIRIGEGERLPTFTGHLQFKDVSFRYPTKPEVEVLTNINLDIKPGDVIAIVGSSGSGKSSIVSLIERFYDVSQGQYLVDDVNIKDLDLKWVHDQIGYVAQEPALFSGSIDENIKYGGDYTDQQRDAAADLAYASEFINNKDLFPEGYATKVGEKGVKLSGGQKQRIAIARALIRNPKVLIFDEATSALDAESEAQVQEAIEKIMTNCKTTMIIIAHRLSTVIKCPRILVMKEGQIVEEGPHEVLVAKNGVYKALIEKQLQGFRK